MLIVTSAHELEVSYVEEYEVSLFNNALFSLAMVLWLPDWLSGLSGSHGSTCYKSEFHENCYKEVPSVTKIARKRQWSAYRQQVCTPELWGSIGVDSPGVAANHQQYYWIAWWHDCGSLPWLRTRQWRSCCVRKLRLSLSSRRRVDKTWIIDNIVQQL